jgi:hypothetical protein
MAFVYKYCEVVFAHDILWNEHNWKPHIFGSFHRCSEIKILDIGTHEFGIGHQNGAVDDHFGHCSVGGWCADIPWIFNEIAAYRHSCSIGLFFLLSIIHTYLSVGYILATVF